MKAQIDENLPPALARAVHAIAVLDDDHVMHVRDLAKAGTKDVDLFEIAARAGIEVHVTRTSTSGELPNVRRLLAWG